jgi:hypothetical protein
LQFFRVALLMLLQQCMIDVTLSILALVAGGVTLELFAAARAPLGYQDDRGFHLGVEQQETAEDLQTGNPS